MVSVPGEYSIVTDALTGGWVVEAEWYGARRIVWRGWCAKTREAMADSSCAMTSLQDCLSWVRAR